MTVDDEVASPDRGTTCAWEVSSSGWVTMTWSWSAAQAGCGGVILTFLGCQLDPAYREHLHRYARVLQARNILLKDRVLTRA